MTKLWMENVAAVMNAAADGNGKLVDVALSKLNDEDLERLTRAVQNLNLPTNDVLTAKTEESLAKRIAQLPTIYFVAMRHGDVKCERCGKSAIGKAPDNSHEIELLIDEHLRERHAFTAPTPVMVSVVETPLDLTYEMADAAHVVPKSTCYGAGGSTPCVWAYYGGTLLSCLTPH